MFLIKIEGGKNIKSILYLNKGNGGKDSWEEHGVNAELCVWKRNSMYNIVLLRAAHPLTCKGHKYSDSQVLPIVLIKT